MLRGIKCGGGDDGDHSGVLAVRCKGHRERGDRQKGKGDCGMKLDGKDVC